jgi:hypothetical protein
MGLLFTSKWSYSYLSLSEVCMEDFELHVPKAVVFALAALSKKSKEDVVVQLAISAKVFLEASYAKYQVKKQNGYSKSLILFGLPPTCKVEFRVCAAYFTGGSHYHKPHVEVKMPLVKGTLRASIKDTINGMMTKVMDDLLSDKEEEDV